MVTKKSGSGYSELGLKRVVNATGHLTLLGGSILSPKVLTAMEEANQSYVDMGELLEKSGKVVAEVVGAEAALVTSGCFAALVLGAAAAMTGKDPGKISRLPDTVGMKNEFLIQKGMRYPYDRCATVPGGKLIEVGDAAKTTARQIEAAIGSRTTGILYFARMDGAAGIVPLAEVIAVSRRKGVVVLVDAAAEVYPLERMTGFVKCGADLVCFGAKYFGSVSSTGLLCGRKELVEAAALNNFVAFESEDNRAIGRGYKVDRQEVVATVVALREWFTMNHEARFQVQEERIAVVAKALDGLPNVKAERVWERNGPWMRLRITLGDALGTSVAGVSEKLKAGDPSVWVRAEGDALYVAVHTLREGEEKVVANRLYKVLSE
jgi:L-seryl-tRNA(Ser) seleniumtransferase